MLMYSQSETIFDD